MGTGPYQVSVTQLLPGGLSATYWDNEWLVDAPAVQRVDAQVRYKRRRDKSNYGKDRPVCVLVYTLELQLLHVCPTFVLPGTNN